MKNLEDILDSVGNELVDLKIKDLKNSEQIKIEDSHQKAIITDTEKIENK